MGAPLPPSLPKLRKAPRRDLKEALQPVPGLPDGRVSQHRVHLFAPSLHVLTHPGVAFRRIGLDFEVDGVTDGTSPRPSDTLPRRSKLLEQFIFEGIDVQPSNVDSKTVLVL